jgi:HSP20 family protein
VANLARTETVFTKLLDFRRDFDDMFSRFLTSSALGGERPTRQVVAVPPIEAWVDNEGKKYHLSIALAGVDPNEVQINLQGNNLTISGEHKSSEEKKNADYLQKEFSYERFERTVVLPEGIDTEKITAECNNGVLEITAPLSAAALPKRIEIKSLPKAKGAGA